LVDRCTALKRLVNPRFLGFREWTIHIRKDRQLRMLLVELTNRRTDSFNTAASPLRETARNLRLAPARRGQASGPIDNVLSLLVRQLAETCPASDAFLVALHEAVYAAPQEPNALTAVEHEPATDQTQLSPTRNGLGRHIELLSQLFDREDLLPDVVGSH